MFARGLFHKKKKATSAKRESPDDIALVERAKHGDKDAYKILVEKYQKRVFSIAYEVTRSFEDAEDVAQETFVKAYLSLRNFKGESSFYTWLYRIAYNMSIDVRRRCSRRGSHVEFEESESAAAYVANSAGGAAFVEPVTALARKEEAKKISAALEKLSEEHRAIILLREVEGLSYDEIAETLKIQKGTVMSRIFYARKQLQKSLIDLAPNLGKSLEKGGAADCERALMSDDFVKKEGCKEKLNKNKAIYVNAGSARSEVGVGNL